MSEGQQRKEGLVVPPMREAVIAGMARWVRAICGLEEVRYFPVDRAYEILGEFVETGEAEFEVLEDHLLGDDDARTYPDRGVIQLRQSVYDGASAGKARPRFTMSHELGHLVMHRNVAFNRVNPESPPKIYQNSEWQADAFASHLLMPYELVRCYFDVEAVMRDFGVSFTAASARLTKVKENGL